MTESVIQVPTDGLGKKLRTRSRTIGANLVEEQYLIVQDEKVVSCRGRATTFRTPGRAGTTGARLLTLHNASGSPLLVDLKKVTVDLTTTVVKAVTVLPPVIRLTRFTALPTGGTVLAKALEDTAMASNNSVVATGDCTADGALSAGVLTYTPLGGTLTQEFAPRLITAAGYEPFDRTEFLVEGFVVLRAAEGVCVDLVYTLATQNPATDMWVASAEWDEFVLP